MITVAKLRNYLKETIVALPELKFEELVIDDSELSDFLKDLKCDSNHFIIGIMPGYPIEGSEDSAKWNNKMMFMILEKTNYKNTDHSAYLDIFERTQETAKKFVYKMLEEKENGEGLFCGMMTRMSESSVNIFPVWKKNGCNGWVIEVDALTDL